MSVFFRTTWFLFRAQARTPLFAVLLAVTLGCAVAPLGMNPAIVKAAVICDNDNSDFSRSLVAQAKGRSALALEQVDTGNLPDEMNRLRSGTLEAIFVVDRGYGEHLKAGEYQNLVKLYLSPYSTSARTFSDSVAAIILSQWLGEAVNEQATIAMNTAAGAEAQRLFASSADLPILLLKVEGDSLTPMPLSPPQKQAHNALFILAALSCFLLLCFPAANTEARDALLDRFASRGWDAASWFFAQSACFAVVPAAAAIIPCVFLAVTGGVGGAIAAWLMFVVYLAVWLSISAAVNSLLRNPSVQLTVASIFAILNAILSFPAGLSQGFGPVRAAFAGYWFSGALQQGMGIMGLVMLGILALIAFLIGLGASRVNSRRLDLRRLYSGATELFSGKM